MSSIVVVTTSYPEHAGDAQGHFVAAEVRRLTHAHDVTVLAPGRGRLPLGAERVISLGGEDAFGFPGALLRLRERPWRAAGAAQFVANALRWCASQPAPARLIAHFLLPCGVPIGTRAVAGRAVELEVVVHGSDARLLTKLPFAPGIVGQELARSRARLRFTSSELSSLVLGSFAPRERLALESASRVEPCVIELMGVLTREQARARLEIPAAARVAVIIARLVPGKRVDVALEACRRVASLQTIVVGDGPERDALTRRFPGAHFTGHLARPLALTYLSAANVLVSASLREGAPTVVREARALGTPVVCLPAGDVARWAETDAGIHVVHV